MMITRAPESRFCAPSWTDLCVARLYIAVAATSEWLKCRLSTPDPSLGRKNAYSRVRRHVRLAGQSADLGRLEGGPD